METLNVKCLSTVLVRLDIIIINFYYIFDQSLIVGKRLGKGENSAYRRVGIY